MATFLMSKEWHILIHLTKQIYIIKMKKKEEFMKIFIICSKAFYDKIAPIQEELEKMGHQIKLPHTYTNPQEEQQNWNLGEKKHTEFKTKMFKKSQKCIGEMDAVLVLNFDKNGQKNYIGGSTFLEVYEAFMQDKKIYFYHNLPEGMLYDELSAFSPVIINEKLELVK